VSLLMPPPLPSLGSAEARGALAMARAISAAPLGGVHRRLGGRGRATVRGRIGIAG